ncbi:putative late blight resistance protein homolog R1A-10 [Salvia hispanica]|uniref:putative late blight resistance protein homolog R1A-10 n=1 Tax=Salvia hispanica TaxID=49212 RepID=UPI00200934BE|nr:putative late blight resistance protein homolog R1A-10 [Salvia hispanica]
MAYILQSLITILEQIMDPKQTRWILGPEKSHLQSLLEKAASLLHILETHSPLKLECLESQIRDASQKAKEIIESNMVDRMLLTPQGVNFTLLTPNVQQVTQELASLMEQVVKLEEGKTIFTSSSYSSSSLHDPSLKSVVVGVDADLSQLMERLTTGRSNLEIVPIVGMGGIGKSTLARNLYDNPIIVSHFDYRGWAAISQDYNIRSILLSLLCGPNEMLDKELIEQKEIDLQDILYKRLYGMRYMIVLDDVWNPKSWDKIKRYLPDNNNGSRIVITTRDSDMAKHATETSVQHHVRLLNRSASWDLLRQIVFGENGCPDPELERVGKQISSDCDGLPLAIHVIGGVLSKVQRSRDVWELISSNVKAAIVESDEQFSNILSLSYNHLPIHLKPCFLYMGAFPEDYVIKGSRLKQIWIAEGFLKSDGDKGLEEVAEDYLKALVERNLLFVRHIKSNGKPMSYSIHDLLRDLCIRKANEEEFLQVKDPQSFVCTDQMIIFPALRLLRVLHVTEMVFDKFPKEILQLVNLRYLAFSCASHLPNGVSRLWNLQTLIAEQVKPSFTSGIWEVSELRHIKLKTLIRVEEGYKMKLVHKKLQTLYHIRITPSLIRSGFFAMIPNIIKLGINYVHSPCIVVDLSRLHKLESLRCQSDLKRDGRHFLQKLRLPCSLRKLNVAHCVLFRSFLKTLCGLGNLEVLKISKCVFESEGDEEWEAAEGDEFCSLQVLSFQSLNLVRWIADETNFPRLRHLIMSRCYELEEIPRAIGDIPTLKRIDIGECSASVVASAQQIQEQQQEEYANYDLKVYSW